MTTFELQVGPVAVLRHPLTSPWAESLWAEEPWATAVRSSPEGRFVLAPTAAAPGRSFGLTRESLPDLRESLLRTNPDVLEDVRRFLERWGLLHVRHELVLGRAIGFEDGLGSDDVAQTRGWLRLLRHCLEAPERRLPKVWRALASKGITLSGHFSVRWSLRGGPEPRLEYLGLLDAMLLALPLWAEEPPPRACAYCGGLMPSPRRNRDYCSPKCGTALRVRRFRQRERVFSRLDAGDTDRMILARYPAVDPADLRGWRREWQPAARSRRRSGAPRRGQRAVSHPRSTGRRPKGARR